MDHKQRFREVIRNIIKQELDEMSTTAGAGPFLTPFAFRGNKQKQIARAKHIATDTTGFKLTPRGEKEMSRQADKLEEGYKGWDYSKVAGKNKELKKPGEIWKTRSGTLGVKNMNEIGRAHV